MVEYSDLLLGLSVESFLVPYQLQCHVLLVLVVVRFDYLKRKHYIIVIFIFITCKIGFICFRLKNFKVCLT